MDILECIEQRRSVRKFLEKEVDGDLIKEIIRLGTTAPTACNRQAWRFIVITEKDVKKKIKNKIEGSPVIMRAPVGILVLYNKFTMNLEYPDNIESAAACIENMLLAATSFNLGSCWINHLPSQRYLRNILQIPERYQIIAYIAVGYPAALPKKVTRKYENVDELISYNKFEMKKEIESRILSRFELRILSIKKPKLLKKILLWILQLSKGTNINELKKVDHEPVHDIGYIPGRDN
jgi:nitroreductase